MMGRTVVGSFFRKRWRHHLYVFPWGPVFFHRLVRALEDQEEGGNYSYRTDIQNPLVTIYQQRGKQEIMQQEHQEEHAELPPY
jgi:hypothetical protein